MTIALGIWGSCLRFKARDERWSGQSEYIAFFEYLLNEPQVKKIVLIGKNDGGWRNMYDDVSKVIQADGRMVKADAAYVFQSQGAACVSTIPGYRWVPATKTEPYRRTKVLSMAENYAAPITHYLNTTNVPWFYMATDVRYIDMVKPKDIANHPVAVLSNIETTIPKWEHITKYLDYRDTKNLQYKTWVDIPVTYAKLQKLNLFFGTQRVKRTKMTNFAVVANKILDFEYRTEQLQKWLPKGTDLYGNLNVPGFNNQFVPSGELDTIFSRVKYTLVLPIYGRGHGKRWLTFKPYEMIRQSVIPFCHPDYDQDGRFVTGMDEYTEFLRVNTPKELKEKIDYLEKRPKYREEILINLEKKLVPPNDLIKYAKNLL